MCAVVGGDETPELSSIAAELSGPMWTTHSWTPRRPADDEADLRRGWQVVDRVGFGADVLATVHQDFADFAAAGDVPSAGPYPIVIEQADGLAAESHRIRVSSHQCTVTVGGPEGARRAVFWLEDLMRSHGGPFLPLGERHREPVITTRISRCFFGPINRPPANRDELLDDVDYYPEHYLNRLAHEGVNGLWLTVRLRDLVPTDWSGPVRGDPQQRLAKLRRTVAACARYGIKIYLFCIDPAAFGDGRDHLVPSEALRAHPGLGGHRTEDWTACCTTGQAGADYVRDSLRTVFSQVPGLGGLIDITIGERPTHCWSDVWSGRPINCPRCGPAGVGPSFGAHLTALRDGIRAGNPDAELISWMYVPYPPETGSYRGDRMEPLLAEIAAHTPEGVTVQVNLESTGVTRQLDRDFDVLDYSLAWVGPSRLFDRVAQETIAAGARMGAKLQVGCSHEVATVPFVPVPGNLYRKYAELHARGVSSVMQCWYFGNAPGPMTTAAGRLAFAPLPATEEEFLTELAMPDWGAESPAMVSAWQHFRDAYAQFPAMLPFSWFGPVHDSIMWPWHLDPVDAPISPSWQLGWPASGDRVGECFAPAYSFDEIVAQVNRTAAQWQEGWSEIAALAEKYADDRARRLDLGVAEALTVQWRSAARTLRFYQLRESLARGDAGGTGDAGPTGIVDELAALVVSEQADTLRLAELADDDPRLGFHSEAEGHKYDPAGLLARHAGLAQLLTTDLVRLRADITAGAPLWPGWAAPVDGQPVVGLAAEKAAATVQALGEGRWSIWRDGDQLKLHAALPLRDQTPESEELVVLIEGRRLWPAVPFRIQRDGTGSCDRRLLPSSRTWHSSATEDDDGWQVELSWPLDIFNAPGMGTSHGFRINLIHRSAAGPITWVDHAPSLRPRLCFEDTNPENLAWVVPAAGGHQPG